MKVLYLNPIFLSYRNPFYKRLKKLFDGDFYVMYSPNRYVRHGVGNLLPKIKEALQENALPFEHEFLYDTRKKSFKRYDNEGGRKVPFTFGLMRAVRRLKPDVLISEGFYQWTPLAVIYSFFMRTKLFIGYERTLHTERNTGRMMTLYRKFIDKFVNGYFVNGAETKKYLLSIGVKPEKIFVGGMSADGEGLRTAISNLSPQDKAEFRTKVMNGANGLMFLFSGRIIGCKGLNHLLEAWRLHTKSHPSDRLIIIGTGSLLELYERDFSDIDSISFEGWVEYDQTYKYYAIADVFILPTIEDNWSLVIPEAMSCGLPVSTSIYNGCHVELVKKDVNGITFDSFDHPTIVEALDYFHHVDLKTFGENSIKLEKEFDTEHCATRVYEALINYKKNK